MSANSVEGFYGEKSDRMGKLYLYESVADTDFHFHFHVLLWVKFDVHFPEPRQHVFYKDYQYEIRALSESGTKLSCFTCR